MIDKEKVYIERGALDRLMLARAAADRQSASRTWARANGLIYDVPPANVREVPATGIGDMSDGYHTFNQLYYQRMMLFAALVQAYKDRAWKSYRHEDGELCFGGGWFIVGIDTPEGSYTYHYENEHFGLFDCVELPVGKHCDGHTEKDVTRLLSLHVGKEDAMGED